MNLMLFTPLNLTPFTPYALRPSGFVAAVARAAVLIRSLCGAAHQLRSL